MVKHPRGSYGRINRPRWRDHIMISVVGKRDASVWFYYGARDKRKEAGEITSFFRKIY